MMPWFDQLNASSRNELPAGKPYRFRKQRLSSAIPAAAAADNSRVRMGIDQRWFPGFCATLLTCLLLFLSGCGLLRPHSSDPKARVTGFQLKTNITAEVTLNVLQLQVMRFADSYVSQVAQGTDDFAAKVGTPQARLAALRWKLGQATSAYTAATGQNPVVNALDMLVLVTVSRMVLEDYGVETFGDAVVPMLEGQRRLETNVWDMAKSILKPEQQQELRDLIQEWRAQHPHLRYVGSVRFREFVAALGKTPSPTKVAPGSIFSLLFLDPFAGLDPTAAAIEETRQLGERAMYYTQRMPTLLSWQAEVLAYQLADQPESQQVLSNAQQIATATAVFARTAEQLPQLINDQRQAAIQQVLDGLRSQNADTRQTLNAGADAATAINSAIQSLDEFVRYVSPTNAGPADVSTNSRPFNVLDYGIAAAQIGNAANNLNALLATVNQSTPQLAELRQQTTDDASWVVDHAFRLGLILIATLLTGSVLAGLVYRVLTHKLTRDSGKPPGA